MLVGSTAVLVGVNEGVLVGGTAVLVLVFVAGGVWLGAGVCVGTAVGVAGGVGLIRERAGGVGTAVCIADGVAVVTVSDAAQALRQKHTTMMRQQWRRNPRRATGILHFMIVTTPDCYSWLF